MKNIQENLLNKIKTGEITMVPRWRFVLHSLLVAVATIVVALIAVYLLSFIMFALHESGLIFAPLFGWSGIVLFIVSSPWILIGLLGIFLCLLYLLVSRYSFSYRKPLVYSIVGVVLMVVAVSSLIQQTALHHRTRDFVERHNFPGLAPLYRNAERKPSRAMTGGIITEINGSDFVLKTEETGLYHVTISNRTKLPWEAELAVGDKVLVFGPVQGKMINAFGVMIDDGSLPPPSPRGGKMSTPKKQ